MQALFFVVLVAKFGRVKQNYYICFVKCMVP